MKIILATLNAKYIHASLAIRYLKAYACDVQPDILLKEYNINQHIDDITADIYLEQPDLVGFACYIWNITETLQIVRLLKKVKPDLKILLGGPEVSYSPGAVLSENQDVNYIIAGEGEAAFRDLVIMLKKGLPLQEIEGLNYRVGPEIVVHDVRPVLDDLNKIPWPYEDLPALADKIIYYECSRGCPFQCQYCLSATFSGIRFFSLERVKNDLQRFIDAGVKQVKFVDRTFNCDRIFTLEIFRFLAAQKGNTNFHFEIAADLLDEETLRFLQSVPPGKFQFEIGVQSTYQVTLELIQRKMEWPKVADAVKRLCAAGNIHLHLDLIAGLPAESYQQFSQSFNDVVALFPGRLQLGFLKMLKGSGVRERAQDFNYIYMDHPPYEVLANRDISYDEMLRLKRIEDMVEKYPNSHQFDAALHFILRNHVRDAFRFFEHFAMYWQNENYHRVAHKMRELYRILAEYYRVRQWPAADVFLELLKFDYLRAERALQLPEFFVKHELPDYQQRFYSFLGDADNVARLMPQYSGLSAREISKRVQVETFKFDVTELLDNPLADPIERSTTLLFQYEQRDPIFHRAKFDIIEI